MLIMTRKSSISGNTSTTSSMTPTSKRLSSVAISGAGTAVTPGTRFRWIRCRNGAQVPSVGFWHFGLERVLELGVGSGLVLSQIAPECVEYWGTDFSAPTIRTLESAVAGQPWGDRVRLRVQPADVVDGLPQGYFDTIIINSVIQYFPNAVYLTEVMDHAVELLAPGGTLFIGDVRNHSLQGAFQTGIALARSGSGMDTDDLRQRVQRAVLGEPELLLSPEFFSTWAAERPVGRRIGHPGQAGRGRQ